MVENRTRMIAFETYVFLSYAATQMLKEIIG